MIIAELPVNETARLKDLHSYNILDTLPESDFDELVELASQVCKCPISIITLLDTDRQWFKASKGMEDTQTPRDVAFCSHAILQENVMAVEDATKDRRFSDNPLVTDGIKIRFYAGAPIISPAGYKLGTICVIDQQPKVLSAEEERALTLISHQVTKLIELRQKNNIIRQRAEEIISIKSNAISSVMQNNRADNKAIAVDLHEGLAQEIASSIMYLTAAEQDEKERLSLIQTAGVQLKDSLKKIRAMSYEIAPITAEWISIDELVKEYIDKVADTYTFDIHFESTGERNASNSPRTTLIIHIIEEWMKLLAEKRNNSRLLISLHTNEHLELQMEDNGQITDLRELGDNVHAGLLHEMAIAEGGKVEHLVPAKGRNIVKVVFAF